MTRRRKRTFEELHHVSAVSACYVEADARCRLHSREWLTHCL